MSVGTNQRPCRSMLYIPGDRPSMLQQAGIYGADSLLLDLEDAVAENEKDSARLLTCGFLEAGDFGGATVVVRINGADTAWFRDDLNAVVPCAPHAVRLPKCDSAADVQAASGVMDEVERACGMARGAVKIHAMVETAVGIERAFEIAGASDRVEALTLGGQDLTADLGVQKTRDGVELFYARGRVVNAAKAAGKLAFDTVWTDLNDMDGLAAEARLAVQMGFSGKAAIHPSQIEVIHQAYRPEVKEWRRARRIVAAAEAAKEQGKGVISVDGRMVDGPIVTRAYHLIGLGELYDMEEE